MRRIGGNGVHGVNVSFLLLQDDEDGNSWVLNSKQGFQDCEMYAKLEEWLGRKVDEYWNTKYDNLELVWFYNLICTGKHVFKILLHLFMFIFKPS